MNSMLVVEQNKLLCKNGSFFILLKMVISIR